MRRGRILALLLAPALVVLAVVTLGPLAYLVVTSLTPLDLTRPGSFRFAGFANYRDLLADGRFWNSVQVQFRLSTATVGAQLALGLGLALLLNRPLPFRETLRTAFVVPMVLPPIIVAIVWKLLFTPLLTPLNLVTAPLGLQQPAWLTDPALALWTIVIADVWEWTAFTMVVLLAALQLMPAEPIEAARVDGATHVQVFTRIILPLARPGIVTAAIFAFLGAWNEFLLGLVLIQENELKTLPVGLALFLQGGPGDTIEWGGRMAAGVMVIVPSLTFFLIASGRIARGLAAGAVKG